MSIKQENRIYSLNLGGCLVRYAFRYPETATIFGKYLREYDGEDYDIRLAQEYMQECSWLVTEEVPEDWQEFFSLMLATSHFLLPTGRALFHGASFLWNDKAWILTAPSGTGKTTQLRNWRNLLRRETKIINGDKPVIICHDDGTVEAASSPWMGKERLGHPNLQAELGGIILLEQGDHNEITRMSPQEAAYALFIEFVSLPDTAGQIVCQGKILEQVLDHVPVWKLINTGDMHSTELTRDTIAAYLEEHHA